MVLTVGLIACYFVCLTCYCVFAVLGVYVLFVFMWEDFVFGAVGL